MDPGSRVWTVGVRLGSAAIFGASWARVRSPTMRAACFGELGARVVHRSHLVKQSIDCIVRLFPAKQCK